MAWASTISITSSAAAWAAMGSVDGLDGVLGATNAITPVVSNLGDSASNLIDPVVSAAGQAVDTVAAGGSVGDVLNGAGNDAGTLIDAVRSDIDSATSNGIVGNVVDGLGDNVVTGAVGGGGLLAGTPLDGLQGDGALVSSNLLQGGDSSSPSSLIELGAGTDQSQGLLNVDAASDRGGSGSGSGSNDLVDTNIGPSSSDNGVNANLLGSSQDSGALIDADAGQTQQAPLATVDAGTNADQFQFPALAGTGVDSLVGKTGQLPGDIVTAETGDGLLPLSAEANDTALADISGPDGVLDSPSGDGTHVAVNTVDTPLQGALI